MASVRSLMDRQAPSAKEYRQRLGMNICLLYTSDAADERSSVDLGGRRIIKKKKIKRQTGSLANR